VCGHQPMPRKVVLIHLPRRDRRRRLHATAERQLPRALWNSNEGWHMLSWPTSFSGNEQCRCTRCLLAAIKVGRRSTGPRAFD